MMRRAICVFLVLGAIGCWSVPAFGDWDESDPYKWLQRPDLSNEGVDVYCTNRPEDTTHRVLADDFLCTSTEPIWDIHIWGSWLNDYLPQVGANVGAESVVFKLSIYGDVPATENHYSYPQSGPALWQWEFLPGSYKAREWATELDEWFFDPVNNEAVEHADHVCWQYNFDMHNFDLADVFIQQGTEENPIVYWLAVEAYVEDPQASFGWKTTKENWNDDATWMLGEEWKELFYPLTHPLTGVSADLAFVITPEPSTCIMLLSGIAALMLWGWRRRKGA